MRIAIAFELHRLRDRQVVVLPSDDGPTECTNLIVDVHSPAAIKQAEESSPGLARIFDDFQIRDINRLYPGFDILTVIDGKPDRLIELKSSGVDAQVQAMSWNEWKTAKGDDRARFWLYLVGNLRADLASSIPFVRAIRDPFGSLNATTAEDIVRRRSVQLRVREFDAADELVLQIRDSISGDVVGD